MKTPSGKWLVIILNSECVVQCSEHGVDLPCADSSVSASIVDRAEVVVSAPGAHHAFCRPAVRSLAVLNTLCRWAINSSRWWPFARVSVIVHFWVQLIVMVAGGRPIGGCCTDGRCTEIRHPDHVTPCNIARFESVRGRARVVPTSRKDAGSTTEKEKNLRQRR